MKETGVQVYFMIYAGINNIQINLENEIEGIYTLKVNLEGTEYTGYFYTIITAHQYPTNHLI